MFSQDELCMIYENLASLKEEEKYRMEPRTQPGLQVKSTIVQAINHFQGPCGLSSCTALEAFPEALELLEQVLIVFENGTVVIDCISLEAIAAPNINAISCFLDGYVHLIVGCERYEGSQQHSINTFCQR